MTEHPLRERLNREFHARPPRPLAMPGCITHRVLVHDRETLETERRLLDKLVDEGGWLASTALDGYRILERNDLCLRWEMHTEFSSYTLFAPAAPEASEKAFFGQSFDLWLTAAPGELMAALRIDHSHGDASLVDLAIARMAPAGEQIVVTSIVDARATLVTDFKPVQGDMRCVLIDHGMTPRQTGRTVQRIWEIETYRMMALLGQPAAKELGGWLRECEESLAALMDGIGSAQDSADEQHVLNQLSRLAAEVEHSVARTAFRFGASRAYLGIIMQRVGELRETRVTGYPTVREFVERRLMPSMATCQAMATRQEELSGRIARNSQLLRTRVDIALERQNQALLEQMNRRTRQQLHLQETVEGLSVVAITYYASQLVFYLAKGARASGMIEWAAESVAAAAIPVIALTVWWGLHRWRAGVGAATDK